MSFTVTGGQSGKYSDHATTNQTGKIYSDGNITTHAQFRVCTFSGVLVIQYNYIHVLAELLVTLNSLACVPTVILNILVLVTIRRMRQLHSPLFVLLCGLALSDLAVGLLVQPAFIGYLIGAITAKWTVNCALHVITSVTGTHLTGVSLLSITTISVERYLALRLRNNFRAVVTTRRVTISLVAMWVAMATISVMFLWYRTFVNAITTLIVVATISVIFLCYFKIFRLLKSHQAQKKTSSQHSSLLNLTKYKKTVVTSLYIVSALLMCYLPWLCSVLAMLVLGYTRPVYGTLHVASTLVYLNSLLNPALYCWRIRDFRQALRHVLRQLL